MEPAGATEPDGPPYERGFAQRVTFPRSPTTPTQQEHKDRILKNMDEDVAMRTPPEDARRKRAKDENPPAAAEEESAARKRARRARSSRGAAAPRPTHLLSAEWRAALDAVYSVQQWENSRKWAQQAARTIEAGEVWMHPPIALPKRYVAEFVGLLHCQAPDGTPWRMLPPSLVSMASGTERQAGIANADATKMPFALETKLYIRNEHHYNYFVPPEVVALTMTRVMSQLLQSSKTLQHLFAVSTLDYSMYCPSTFVQGSLQGLAPRPLAILEHVAPETAQRLRRFVGAAATASTRPARRKVVSPSVSPLSDSDAAQARELLGALEVEIKRKIETKSSRLQSPEQAAVALRAYAEGDVVCASVPCTLLLAYSAALRLDCYRLFKLIPAIIELDFDQELNCPSVEEADKALLEAAEAAKVGPEWRELRKENARVLDTSIQVFLDFTLTQSQEQYLMLGEPETTASVADEAKPTVVETEATAVVTAPAEQPAMTPSTPTATEDASSEKAAPEGAQPPVGADASSTEGDSVSGATAEGPKADAEAAAAQVVADASLPTAMVRRMINGSTGSTGNVKLRLSLKEMLRLVAISEDHDSASKPVKSTEKAYMDWHAIQRKRVHVTFVAAKPIAAGEGLDLDSAVCKPVDLDYFRVDDD